MNVFESTSGIFPTVLLLVMYLEFFGCCGEGTFGVVLALDV